MKNEPANLFIVGCPRSGTTWVQLLLAQNPGIATAPETQIFAYYLDHFRAQWEHEQRSSSREQGGAGLSRLLTEEEFLAMCRAAAQVVLDRIASNNPEARVVAEKSPKHALMADFIRSVYPRSMFLHVIRDPRDTVASLLAAGRSWGGGWAPRSAVTASRLWMDSLEAARRVREPAAQYREVRYEALKANPVAELGGIFDWLEVPLNDAAVAAAVAACDLKELQKAGSGTRLPVPGKNSPKGFFRSGMVGGWSNDLTTSEARAVEHVCGAAMDALGYERAFPKHARSGRTVMHDAIRRVRESIDWQLQRLLQKV